MFSSISWGDYFIGAGAVLGCYYASVALACYRGELRSLFSGVRKNVATGDDYIPDLSLDAITEMSRPVIKEIHSILHAAGKDAAKPELLKALRLALADFPGLRVPACRDAVFNYIVREGQTICGVGIGVDELEA